MPKSNCLVTPTTRQGVTERRQTPHNYQCFEACYELKMATVCGRRCSAIMNIPSTHLLCAQFPPPAGMIVLQLSLIHNHLAYIITSPASDQLWLMFTTANCNFIMRPTHYAQALCLSVCHVHTCTHMKGKSHLVHTVPRITVSRHTMSGQKVKGHGHYGPL